LKALEVVNASYGYTEASIFEDLHLEVEKGQLYCLFGPNGCGKSTLLRCLTGVLRLRSGEIYLHGERLSKLSPGQIARHVSYVPQIHERSFPYTVREFVLMGRTPFINLFSAPSPRDIAVCEEAIHTVRMEEYLDRPYTQLSGGELQLVIIARALAQGAPIVVMDEPTSHLDFKNDLAVLELIVELVKEKGLTVLIATHFPNHAFYFENNGLPVVAGLMADRQVVATGLPSQVLTEENMRRVFGIDSKLIRFYLPFKGTCKHLIPLRITSSHPTLNHRLGLQDRVGLKDVCIKAGNRP
jgi:iron complex transport system ATP-binding protein